MTTTLADTLEAAVCDGGDLVRWAEANTLALEDERIDALVQKALRSSVPDWLRGDAIDDPRATMPLLRFADGRHPPVSLIDATANRPRQANRCDRCTVRGIKTTRLIVPAGQSAVAIYFCNHCRGVLQDVFACGLVWG